MDPSTDMQLMHDNYDARGRALADELNHRRVQGGNWTHEAHYNVYGSTSLHHPSGLGLFFIHRHSHRAKDAGRRLTVSGLYPRGFSGYQEPEITVALDRNVVDIIGDVVRKLLPGYLATYEIAHAQAVEAEEHRRARVVMNRRMEQALPGLSPRGGPSPDHPDRERSYWSGQREAGELDPAYASGGVRVSTTAKTVEMQLSNAPAELALVILELFNPNPALEGVIAPHVLTSARTALPPATHTIAGQVVRSGGLPTSSSASGPEPSGERSRARNAVSPVPTPRRVLGHGVDAAPPEARPVRPSSGL